MEILVLGGTQFIGLRLVELLVRQSHRVTVLNRGVSPATLPESVSRLTGDRFEPESIAVALRGRKFDVVMDISVQAPVEIQPVLEALAGNFGQYVLCGTVGYYTPGDIAPIREDHPVDESAPKILSEKLLMSAAADDGFTATVLRAPVVYGPHNSILNREAAFFARLSRGRPIILADDGMALLHSVHVDDLAAAFLLVAGNDLAAGQIYNVCDSAAYTHRGYAATIAEAMGLPLQPVFIADSKLMDEAATLVPGIFPFGTVDICVYNDEKIRWGLGWRSAYALLEGMVMTYQWWLDQGGDKAECDYSAEDALLARLNS